MIALSGQACVFEVSPEFSAEAIDRIISVKEALLRVIKRQTVLVLTDHSPERILCLCFIPCTVQFPSSTGVDICTVMATPDRVLFRRQSQLPPHVTRKVSVKRPTLRS